MNKERVLLWIESVSMSRLWSLLFLYFSFLPSPSSLSVFYTYKHYSHVMMFVELILPICSNSQQTAGQSDQTNVQCRKRSSRQAGREWANNQTSSNLFFFTFILNLTTCFMVLHRISHEEEDDDVMCTHSTHSTTQHYNNRSSSSGISETQ